MMKRWLIGIGLIGSFLWMTAVWALNDQTTSGDCSPIIGEVGGNSTITCNKVNNYGIPPAEYLRVAKELGITSERLGVTQKVLDSFLQTVGKKQVPLEKLDSTLTEIAQRYKDLLAKTEALTSDDPEVKKLQQEAAEALKQEKLDFETADKLLNQAQEKDAVAILALEDEDKRIQEALDKRKLSRATTLATLAESKMTQLAYLEAAKYYQEAAERLPEKFAEQLALYLNEAGVAFNEAGQYTEAKPLYERSLAIREKVLGKEHLAVAPSLNNLAELYRVQGQYAQAKPLYERSLAVNEKVLGKEHPDVAASLGNLAGLYRAQGEYTQARPLYERSLAIFEKILGKENPNVARSLNNLGELYQTQGEYAKALPLHERSLAIREKVLGKEHPHVATSLNNLATLYHAQGEYEKALPLHQRSLAILEKVLGKEHPDVATSLNNLAELYRAQGQYAQAKPLYERSLAVNEKVLGKEHLDVAVSLGNLAGLYYAQREYDQARPLLERSLAIQEKVLDKEHPDVAVSFNNLALLYQAQGEYEKALPLCERSVAIAEKKLGKNHPNTKKVTENLHRVQQHLNGRFQVLVKSILPDSQAVQLGIQVGDIFTHYDNQLILGTSRFINGRKKELADGPAKELKVLRDGKELIFKIKPGKIGAELEEKVK